MDLFFHWLSVVFVYGGIVSAIIIAIDIWGGGHHPKMKVMAPVWVLTGLWASYLGLFLYFTIGRSHNKEMSGMKMKETMPMNMNQGTNEKRNKTSVHPDPIKVGISTLHCGSGCTLADLIGETFTLWFPLAIAGSILAGQWVLDYLLALLIGMLFQYAAIQPMLHLPVGKAMVRALKIDFLSLTAWQMGMYGWMALMMFVIFPHGISKRTTEFWFMMQIAMLFGFLTSYPVNWFLIKAGIKPEM